MGADVPVSDRVLVSRYRLGALLGRGGMAEVYDGYDERLHRPVAIKLLRPDMAVDPGVRTRFEVEARSAARLSHPNVVAVFDTGDDSGAPFIVMERLPGETLADRMSAGPVDQSWVRRLAGDVLGALGAAHAAGLVHRDVKPGNILIADDGCAKVADFGIAKSAEVVGDLTGTGLLIGTPAYLAPERLDGRPATPQSDLYSLGVVLYEALAGVKPFDGPNPVATANAVMHDELRPLRDLRPDVEPDLAATIEHAMAKDPAARPKSAGEMAGELRRPVTGTDPDSTVTIAGTVRSEDPTLLGAPAAVPPVAGPRAEVDRSRGHRVPGGGRPSHRHLGLAAAAVLVLGLVVAAVAASGGGGGDAGRDALAAAIRDLAGRVQNGDGVKGPEASQRLEMIADQVEAGGGADDANSLLRDAAQWNGAGDLSTPATTEMAAVLSRIDGVDPSLATTTTTTVPPPPPPRDEDGDKDDSDGKGKGKGRD